MMSRCLQDFRGFRLAVMLQMCGGVLFLVEVLLQRLIVGVFLFCVRFFRRTTVVFEKSRSNGLEFVAGMCQLVVLMHARPVWIDHNMRQTERGLPGVTRVDAKLFSFG